MSGGAAADFTLYPAIDLRGGRCVRLRQGDPDRQEVFSENPEEVARAFAADGAPALHVVDLDGAFAGRPLQLPLVARLARAVELPLQFGGGLRTEADVEAAFAAGAARVVVGTRALDPAFFGRLLGRFGAERVIAGLDARGDHLAVEGWRKETEVGLREGAERLRALGAAEAVFTQVRRDGMLSGPDLEGIGAVLAAGLRVVASGGVSRVEDVRALGAMAPRGVSGAIVGRALYTGALRLPDALAAVRTGGG